MSSEIVHDPTRRRFEHTRDGMVSYLVYHPLGETTVDFASTYTPPPLRGRGIAARLVRQALQWAEAEGLEVVSSCWFVTEFVERNPQWKRVIAGR
jgi:uncharacterized protein